MAFTKSCQRPLREISEELSSVKHTFHEIGIIRLTPFNNCTEYIPSNTEFIDETKDNSFKMMKLLRLCLMLLGIAAVASAGGLRGGAVQPENEIVSEHQEGRELHAQGHFSTIYRNHGAYGNYVQPTYYYNTNTNTNTNSWYSHWNWNNYYNSNHYNRNGFYYYNRPNFNNNYYTGHRQGGYSYYYYSF